MYKYLFATLIGFLFCVSVVNAECINTMTNKSQLPWTVRLTAYKKLTPPVGSDSSAVKNGYLFTINPGETLKLNLNSIGSGYIIMTDKENEHFSFGYAVFASANSMRCPYIYHYNQTGAVTLNDPQDGDITIEKDTWAAAEPDRIMTNPHYGW